MNCGPMHFRDVVAVVDAENSERAKRGGVATYTVHFEDYCRIEIGGVNVKANGHGWSIVVDSRVVAQTRSGSRFTLGSTCHRI
jgi:hypothetical protein